MCCFVSMLCCYWFGFLLFLIAFASFCMFYFRCCCALCDRFLCVVFYVLMRVCFTCVCILGACIYVLFWCCLVCFGLLLLLFHCGCLIWVRSFVFVVAYYIAMFVWCVLCLCLFALLAFVFWGLFFMVCFVLVLSCFCPFLVMLFCVSFMSSFCWLLL